MTPRYKQILRKSAEAMLAAVEVYNKPRFEYREESFAILSINAWELLLKARILQLSANKPSSLYVYEKKKNLDGSTSKKRTIKRNRSGSPQSLGLIPCYRKLVSEFGEALDKDIQLNLICLTEVRDNAVHFYNKPFELRKKVHEFGTANLSNFLNLSQEWFGEDLTQYEFFLMPLAFINTAQSRKAIKTTSDEQLAIDYFEETQKSSKSTNDSGYSVSLNVEVNLSKGSSKQNVNFVKFTNNPNAKQVHLSDADFKERYPWSYKNLTQQLRKSIPGFKQSQKYHDIRQKLEKDPNLCRKRYLDPDNKKSSFKNWYNPNIAKLIKELYLKED